MNPQAEEVEYEGLPNSAGHRVHMFAGALVSSAANRNAHKTVSQGGNADKMNGD
jgi:hypothetical protein